MIKILSDILKNKKKRKRNKMFSQYPCEDYLHNALHFLSYNEPNVAYEEICNALIRSGAKLSDTEQEMFDKIRSEKKIK